MRTQAERDEQTITIAIYLALIVGVLVAGAVVGSVITSVGLSAPAALAVGYALVAGSTGLVVYAWRNRSPQRGWRGIAATGPLALVVFILGSTLVYWVGDLLGLVWWVGALAGFVAGFLASRAILRRAMIRELG